MAVTIAEIEKVIEDVKTGVCQDPSIKVFMYREAQVVKDAGMYDMAWVMTQNYPVRSEVVWFFKEICDYMKAQEK
jgi:hypothetical protein